MDSVLAVNVGKEDAFLFGCTVFFFGLTFHVMYTVWKKLSGYPPGPWGIPLLGFYPFLGRDPHRKLQQIANQYGDIVSINLLGVDYYFLNSIDVIKEAFIKNGEVSSGRPLEHYDIFRHSLGSQNVGVTEGIPWKKHRKLIQQSLTDQGLGKASLEPKIHQACELLVQNIESTRGEDYDYYDLLTNYTSDVLTSLLYSKLHKSDDPSYMKIRNAARKFFETASNINGLLMGSTFETLFRFTQHKNYKNIEEVRQISLQYFEQIIDERLSKRVYMGDYVDKYLSKSNSMEDTVFDRETLASNLMVMFTAGTESTSLTMYYAINLMALYPDVQSKVQQEIDQTIGDRKVSLEDTAHLHYTNAVIHEIHRYACIAPFPSPHSATDEFELNGYKIPKRAVIVYNVGKLARDPKYYKNPHDFDPTNFLDENGLFKKSDSSIPFGTGKRICLGFKLAETEIFIGFVTLMQKFRWMPPSTGTIVHKRYEGFVFYLEPFKMRAFSR